MKKIQRSLTSGICDQPTNKNYNKYAICNAVFILKTLKIHAYIYILLSYIYIKY